ncbi:hypothetical protein [Bradyrhizobium sp. Ce-3]|uniref:hypothetical protein n=1 Tax=Bradyrhizobium sp. Ce-3 TaxID=2913970 RepID=UPI001FC803E5|nr:hypothetical protein [Bradyrhizobium sp. Ce-3]
MSIERRRFRQTKPLRERLLAFAKEAREEASRMPVSEEREALLKHARQAETASHLDEWISSPGLKSPT